MEEKELQNEALPTDNEAENSFNPNADDNQAGTTHLNDLVQEENELERLENELADQKDKYVRLLAEFENFKRRNAKERLELMQTANKETVISLLDVLDDCDRAEQVMQSSEDVVVIKEGVQLVFQKLRSNLQAKGLKALESKGLEFNTDFHEAITEIPSPSEELVGKVIDEVTKGYLLNDKLVRFAKVVVGK